MKLKLKKKSLIQVDENDEFIIKLSKPTLKSSSNNFDAWTIQKVFNSFAHHSQFKGQKITMQSWIQENEFL